MDGFSAEDAELAIGYYLGLRWFQLTRVQHNKFTIIQNPSQDIYRCECTCGNSADLEGHQVPGWYGLHSPASAQPVLRGARDAWQPGANHARCLRVMPHYDDLVDHHVPVRKCSCGFWAYWHLGDQQTASPYVAALIKGSGRVIKGPLGFRCSEAEIIALTLAEPDPPAALALEARYGVPVYYSINGLLLMHPAPDGQPPLEDAWFRKHGRSPVPAPGQIHRSGGNGGLQPGETLIRYSRRTGLFSRANPCVACGRTACAEGQPLCAACQIAKTETRAIIGADALNQLHARRESWATSAVEQITKAFGIPGPGGTS